jgi:tetratricopeptide (TPR) repeat protein
MNYHRFASRSLWLPLSAVSLLLLAPASGHAQELSEARKTQLRAVAPVPQLGYQFNFRFNSQDFTHLSDTADPKTRLFQLLLLPVPTSKDDRAQYLLDLANGYQKAESYTDAKKKFQEAEALYQELLREHPESRWRYLLGLSKTGEGLGRADVDREALLREATQLAPKRWETWSALGEHILGTGMSSVGEAVEALRPPGEKSGSYQFNYSLTEGNPPKENLPAAARLQKAMERVHEAGTCFDKAISLAPNAPEAHAARFNFAFMQIVLQSMNKYVKGDNVDFDAFVKENFHLDSMMEDLEKLSLSPSEEAQRISLLTLFKASRALAQQEKGEEDYANNLFAIFQMEGKEVPPAARKELENGTARLLKMGKDAQLDATSRAKAMEGAGVLLQIAHKTKESEEAAREAVRLDPTCTSAFQFLATHLTKRNSWQELAALSEARLAAFPAEERDLHMYLATAAVGLQDDVRAEKEYRSVLTKSPDDAKAIAGLAVVRMRQSEADPKALEEAKALLEKLPAQEKSRNTLAYCVYDALTGKAADAIASLQKIRDGDDNKTDKADAVKLLAILE